MGDQGGAGGGGAGDVTTKVNNLYRNSKFFESLKDALVPLLTSQKMKTDLAKRIADQVQREGERERERERGGMIE